MANLPRTAGIAYDERGRERPPVPESEREFHKWKATTASLILESVKPQDQKWLQEKQEEYACHLARLALEVIGRYCRDPDEGVLEHLTDIIMKSVDIDQDIGKQAARIDLAFLVSEDPIGFDADYMETESRGAASLPRTAR